MIKAQLCGLVVADDRQALAWGTIIIGPDFSFVHIDLVVFVNHFQLWSKRISSTHNNCLFLFKIAGAKINDFYQPDRFPIVKLRGFL
jgi:hypothetical protein